MATGGSSLKCGFCESFTEKFWNCKECKLKLCEICNHNIHTKISSNLDHTVSNPNEIENESKETDAVFKYPCAIHADSSCFAICSHCSECVCKYCLKKPNKEFYDQRLATIQEYEEKIDNDLPFFTEQLESFNQLEEKYEAKYNEVKDQIFDRKEKLKRLATEETIKLERELDGLWNPAKKAMKDERTRMTEAERDLTTRKDIIKKALSSKDAGSIISAVDKVTTKMPEKKVPSIKEPPNIIFSTKFSTEIIALGSIMKVPKLMVSGSHACDVTDILTIYDDQAIVGYDKNKRLLKQFVLTSDGVYVAKTFECPKGNRVIMHVFTSITTCGEKNSQNLLIRNWKKTDTSFKNAYNRWRNQTDLSAGLLQLSFRGSEYTSLDNCSIKDSSITAVHFDNKEKIFVAYQSYSSFKGIVIFNTKFEKLQQLEIGQVNDKPFIHSKSITTNVNDDICIIDEPSKGGALSKVEEPAKGEGRLVVFNKSVKFRWEFAGPDDGTKGFFPEQIATSSKGYIFISDTMNNRVYMLSKDGHLLGKIGETDGIEQPSGLAVNKKDQLFVGCPGKLHIVEF